MKTLQITIFFLFGYFCLNAQKLSISDLQNICNKPSWEQVNRYLENKGWEYYDSEKGGSYKYNTITWSFNRSYGDAAQAWFYLYTYEGVPSKIGYNVFNKSSYSLVKNGLRAKKYRLKDSEIEDNQIISKYTNTQFNFNIVTENRKDSEYEYTGETTTSYSFFLIKKAGIYDPDNGEKIDYFLGTNKKRIEYSLKNGKFNGNLIAYYENGNIKKRGTYLNNKENGYFKEYSESGDLEFEYYMKNGVFEKERKSYYSNGQVEKSGSFKGGKKHGVFIEYTRNGKMSDYRSYRYDVLNGPFKSFDDNLVLRKTGKYVKGKENGMIKECDKNGVLEFEGLMENGKRNGSFKIYFYNGQVKIQGGYLDGKQSGSFSEFFEDGALAAIYSMKNDKLNGTLTLYENNKKSEEKEYRNGALNGMYRLYIYDDSNVLHGIQSGEYLNGKEHGYWQLLLIKNLEKERVLGYTSYEYGIKNGPFMEAKGDSVIYGAYRNNALHGDYKIYKDLTKWLNGGIINTDSTELQLACKGRYSSGVKSDRWYVYGISGALNETGTYQLGKKNGPWLYYYGNFSDSNGGRIPYSGQLFLKETYKNGLKDGPSIRYSKLDTEEYPCDENHEQFKNENGLCSRYINTKLYQSVFYKKDQLHGPCLGKDSSGTLLFQGTFEYEKKVGDWLESHLVSTVENDEILIFEKGNYLKGKRTGQWKEFFIESTPLTTSTYSGGVLHGELVNYNSSGAPKEIKFFENGKLKWFKIYDEQGMELTHKYEILRESVRDLKVKRTKYEKESIISQIYSIVKEKPEINHEFFEFYFLTRVSNMKDGYPDGEYVYINKNGLILIQGTFLKEEYTGIWLYNFPKQKVQIQIEYKENSPGIEKYMVLNSNKVFSGVFVYNDEENNIKEQRKVKNGLRQGSTVYRDENGKKIKTEKYKKGLLK